MSARLDQRKFSSSLRCSASASAPALINALLVERVSVPPFLSRLNQIITATINHTLTEDDLLDGLRLIELASSVGISCVPWC